MDKTDRNLARDETGVLCRFCVPAHGTIRQLLACICVTDCGAAECTGDCALCAETWPVRCISHVEGW